MSPHVGPEVHRWGISDGSLVSVRELIRRLGRVSLLAALVLAGPALTQNASAEAANASTEAAANETETLEGGEKSWDERLRDAHDRIGRARLRAAKAEAAYSRARHDGHPRGEALAGIKEEWDAAAEELKTARAVFPELLEEARRAGVERGVLRRYED